VKIRHNTQNTHNTQTSLERDIIPTSCLILLGAHTHRYISSRPHIHTTYFSHPHPHLHLHPSAPTPTSALTPTHTSTYSELTGTNTRIGFSSRDRALSSVSRNSENPKPDLTEAATVKVFLY
jgi:hypothetical protein